MSTLAVNRLGNAVDRVPTVQVAMDFYSDTAQTSLSDAMHNLDMAKQAWYELRHQFNEYNKKEDLSVEEMKEMDRIRDDESTAHDEFLYWQAACISLHAYAGGATQTLGKRSSEGDVHGNRKKLLKNREQIDLSCKEDLQSLNDSHELTAINSPVFSAILTESLKTNSADRLIHEVALQRNTTHRVLQRGLELEEITKRLMEDNDYLSCQLEEEKATRAVMDSCIANVMPVFTMHITKVFTCCITQEPAEDPVLLNGSYYSRVGLMRWLNQEYSDPITRELASGLSLESGHIASDVLNHLRSVADSITTINKIYVEGECTAINAMYPLSDRGSNVAYVLLMVLGSHTTPWPLRGYPC